MPCTSDAESAALRISPRCESILPHRTPAAVGESISPIRTPPPTLILSWTSPPFPPLPPSPPLPHCTLLPHSDLTMDDLAAEEPDGFGEAEPAHKPVKPKPSKSERGETKKRKKADVCGCAMRLTLTDQ